MVFSGAFAGSDSAFLPSDFLSWANSEAQKIETSEHNSQSRKIKLSPIVNAKEAIKSALQGEDSIEVKPNGEFIYTSITQLFEGNYHKAASLYWDITSGKKSPNLFIESGAGAREKISDVKESSNTIEFVTDRVYKSSLAFNTKTTTRLRRFDIPSQKMIIIVNELVKDWGKSLSKPYGPVHFDLVIDIYQEADPTHFRYQSFSVFKGQGMKSNNQALNVAKDVGDLFSLGMLNKSLKSKIESEATTIWQKRKALFQEVLK